ncbi:uncharacterized protein LOC119726802 isoform X2 [Patiria miniata]|uniref:Uncharacterized protein n=1 Tax=Patiria miniata TaxID=46514 RepID=A0A913ZT31_PATMI|nr:uncharacterized protein LOC119726802 isoform X2 [Patiria miniata]
MAQELGLFQGPTQNGPPSVQHKQDRRSFGGFGDDGQGMSTDSMVPDISPDHASRSRLNPDQSEDSNPQSSPRPNRLTLSSVEFHRRAGNDATSSSASVWKDGESLNSEETMVQQLMRKISHVGNGDDGPKTAANYTGFPSGFQRRNYYEHSKKLTDLVDVTYNPRTRQFIFLDTRGITTWDKDGIEHTVTRSLSYPKYVNKLLRNIIYARKYNVYFCLAKDFSLKVLNKDFDETCNVASDLSSVMFLIFNPVRDELITGGVKGTKVWEFKQVTDQVWTEIKPMANYGLFLKRELSGIKGGWIRKVELEQQLQHLYCCSDTDVLCYNMDGKPLFRLVDAHKSQINGCKYSPQAKTLITCSNDSDVKVWSMTGGHVHTFRGHSRSVTGVVLHPDTSTLVLTSSTDGTVRMWSLDIMEPMYTIVISTDGIEWLGLTGERFLWTATHRDLGVWHLNHVVQFYALARCRVTSLHVAGCEGKTSRLVAVGEDSSVRLISMKDQKSLSTVLPPPSISPLQQVLGVTYNRECSVVYLLISPQEIWVYTMRTDPACRTAVWDTEHLQDKVNRGQSAGSRAGSAAPTTPRLQPGVKGLSSVQLGHTLPTHRASQGRGAHTTPSPCTSIATITTPVMYWTEEGFVCPLNQNFLVLGLQDGRILLMDPMEYGHRYCELQASKDAIFDMEFDHAHSALVAKSHLRDEDVYQFWSLPSLELQHLVVVPRDVTAFARLGSVFLTGHSEGSLSLHQLKPVTNMMGYPTNDVGEEMRETRRDHTAPIVAVDSCLNLAIFVSCSSDGAVKVWDADKLLLTEIALDEPISCARFINARGDLMMGYMNHLFVIDHTKILPSSSKTQFPDENLETESEIYEDPAVRYEGAAENPDPLDLDSYLVPYNLDFNERFRGGRASPSTSHASSVKSGDEDSGSEFSLAPTEMYTSPYMTPRRLSAIDLLTSGQDTRRAEITSRVKALSLTRKRRSRSSRLNLTQTDDVQLDFDMPQFGISPGPSPTPSPPSSGSDFDVSEDESEIEDDSGSEAEEEGEETQHKEAGSKMTVRASELEEVKKKESKEIKVGDIRLSDLKQPPEEVSKYSMSKMKIDAKSLLKQKIPVTIPKPLKLDRTSQPLMATVAEIKTLEEKVKKPTGQPRMKTPVKKKMKKGERVRVGDRAAANRAKLAAEPSAETIPSPTVPSTTDMTTATKLTVSLEGGVKEKVQSGVIKKVSSSSASSSSASLSQQTSDSSIKPKPKVSIPALPKAPKDSKPEDKKSSKPADKPAKAKPEKGKPKSVLDDWKKPKGGTSATETTACVSDEEVQRAMSAGTSGSSGRPASSVHGADVATDLGEGSTAMYKAAARMAIANKYNPLRSKSAEATPSLTDTQPDTVTNLDPEGLGDAGELESLRADSRFDGVLSRGSVQSVTSPPGRDLESPAATSGQRSRMEGTYADGEEDQDTSTRPPSRHQVSPEQVATTPSPKISSTLPPRPKSHIALPPRPTRLVDRDHATREARPEDRYRGKEVFVPTASTEEQVLVKEEMEGRLARPNTAEGRSLLLQRPHTAGATLHVNFEDETALDGHDTPIARYLSCPGSPVDLRHIYRNDGLHFEDNWQEKMIVRHHILKQQKEQRAQSAADRRRLLELRKRQRRKALLGHHHCATDGTYESPTQETYVTRSDTSLHKMKRCQSAPIGRMVPSSSPPVQPQQAFGQSKEVDLSSETPYRFRINRSAPQSAKPRIPPEEIFEEVAPDPSHPGSLLIKRPQSTKSIPSKTRRYVLVTKVQDDPDIPVPTVLERQLLKERFPQTRHRIKHLQEIHRRNSIPNMELINISSVGDGPFS